MLSLLRETLDELKIFPCRPEYFGFRSFQAECRESIAVPQQFPLASSDHADS